MTHTPPGAHRTADPLSPGARQIIDDLRGRCGALAKWPHRSGGVTSVIRDRGLTHETFHHPAVDEIAAADLPLADDSLPTDPGTPIPATLVVVTGCSLPCDAIVVRIATIEDGCTELLPLVSDQGTWEEWPPIWFDRDNVRLIEPLPFHLTEPEADLLNRVTLLASRVASALCRR